jgi:hypothetical protein
MKIINKVGAQGDVFFVRVNEIPDEAKLKTAEQGRHVVAHSETGHHHTIQADGVVLYEGPNDPFTCYLRVDAAHADVVHLRPFDTHETVQLPAGLWMVRRQREYTPEGFRRVED